MIVHSPQQLQHVGTVEHFDYEEFLKSHDSPIHNITFQLELFYLRFKYLILNNRRVEIMQCVRIQLISFS